MSFNKYTSLDSALKQFTIDAVITQGFNNMAYVTTEKIHGANFSAQYRGTTDTVKFCRKGGWLKPGESFYSHTKLDLEKIEKVVKYLAHCNGAKTVEVYGEICGGYYDGEQELGCKRVQTQVQYSSKTEFIVFDIRIDGRYIPFLDVVVMCGICDLMHVPVAGVFDSFEDALAANNEYMTMVPKLLGNMGVVKDNICEGNVIRPLREEVTFANGKRLVLKNKNAKFSETKDRKPKVPTPELTSFAQSVLQLVTNRLNRTRLDAVISKESNVSQKDFGKITGLLIQDAIADAEAEGSGAIKESMKDEWKAFSRAMQAEATLVVREYWVQKEF